MNPNPMRQFENWFGEAKEAEKSTEPNAMCISTVSSEGRPSSRYVLMKGVDDEGNILFFTNYESRKGKELAINKFISCLFYWPSLHRCVRIDGSAFKLDEKVCIDYFSTRPLKSQISSSLSPQSQIITQGDKELLGTELERIYKKAVEDGKQSIGKPIFWGGYKIVPDNYEFWQGQTTRYHDRFFYRKNEEGKWDIDILAP